mgnify:CR=1 FL=1
MAAINYANFGPKDVKGIDPEGTLFEKTSGKKLAYDADVEIKKEYYLLKTWLFFIKRSYSSIRIQEIIQKQFSWEDLDTLCSFCICYL